MAANGENKGEGEEEKEDEEKDEEEEEEEEGVQDENGDGSSSSKAAEGKERMEESGSNGDEDISGAYHIIPSALARFSSRNGDFLSLNPILNLYATGTKIGQYKMMQKP